MVQAEQIAKEAPELLERLPKALRRAVATNSIPNDLERDVTALADWLEPMVPELQQQAKQAAAKAQELAEQAKPASQQAAQVEPLWWSWTKMACIAGA